jgi:hypothetical protein
MMAPAALSTQLAMDMMPSDNELYRRIDEIVHYLWDPIGVSGSPYARDEYDSYLTSIFGRVKGGDIEGIVEYMKWVVTERMGMIFDETRARKAAERMLEWKNAVENPR